MILLETIIVKNSQIITLFPSYGKLPYILFKLPHLCFKKNVQNYLFSPKIQQKKSKMGHIQQFL